MESGSSMPLAGFVILLLLLWLNGIFYGFSAAVHNPVSYTHLFVHSHLGSLDLHDLGNYLVQKITVMRNDKYSARVVEKIGLKPCNALHIQMVGRLVQKENIRFVL